MRVRMLVLGLAIVSMLALAASAGAKTVELHSFSSSFDGSDANGAPVPAFESDLEKIDVDKASGDVFVGDGNVVYKFDSAGVSQPFSALAPATVLTPGIGGGAAGGLAVDNSGGSTQGRIYAFAEQTPMRGYLPSGLEAAGFPVDANGDTCGAAVDGSGNIWRQAYAQGIYEYAPDGTPTGQEVEIEGPLGFCDFAMDAQGNFYALSNYLGGTVSKYAPDGTFLQLIDGTSNAKSVAVDRGTGDIYVDTQTSIEHYGPAGDLIESFGSLTESNGVAVDSTTHAVYALDNGPPASVKKYLPTTTQVADANTEAETDLTRTGATFNGTVNPIGLETTGCRFEYTTVENHDFSEASLPCAEGENFDGNADVPVSAVFSTGTGETEYLYRLQVTDANGPVYGAPRVFKTFGAVKATQTGEATGVTQTHATLHGSFDPDGLDTHYWFEYGPEGDLSSKAPLPVPPGVDAGSAPGGIEVAVTVSDLDASKSSAGRSYSYRLAASNATGTTIGNTRTFHVPTNVNGVTTLPAENISLTGATFRGSFEPGGVDTHYYFEWGPTIGYGRVAPTTAPPGVDGGESNGVQTVSLPVTGLEGGVNLHYRIVAENANGATVGGDQEFRTEAGPVISGDLVTKVNTDTAVLEGAVNPGGLETKYHWEIGPEDCATSQCLKTAETALGTGAKDVHFAYSLEELTPGATYHFRLVAVNSRKEVFGEDHTFTTYENESGVEECPNVLERKQTGAGVAPRCRGYELVSAANTGGYDVESNLVAGLEPLPGFPNADGKVLYTMRFGSIPGSGNPPNKGGDPYVATRGENGWTTKYVGLQANGTPSAKPFSSTLLEADQTLSSFAFGGPETCDPCFADGSTNIPLRLPDGELVKGMAGAENPAADPVGEIARRFSADGSHFVFGSTSKFEPTGNEGSLSFYERDLSSQTTEVVSTMPDGTTMPGAGTVELDISNDGSRVLIGRQVGTDGGGNPLYDLYMHVGNDSHSVQVADTAGGVLYSGMTADGSQVFFTTTDPVTDDTDTSADLFRADVTATGSTVNRVSTGEGSNGDTNGCDPDPNSDGNHWNQPGSASTANCGVVAIGGGGGVASESGTAYFLSPELLTAGGVANQPNLYAAESGKDPVFVATLEPDNPMVRDSVSGPGHRETADFQTTPDGRYAVLASAVQLTDATSAGFDEVYRTDLGGPTECASCPPSNAAPTSDTGLTSGGLNLTDDGRVFFTSSEQLVLRDTNKLKDAYEWDNGAIGIISTGLDSSDSGLLSASADGRDVFFFTRQRLAPQDENGGAMKIYDAREGGGFLYNPPTPECVASDECHGPGTQQAPPPPINTIEGKGEALPPGEEKSKPKGCPKGKVKRHGKCVKPHKKKHPKRHGRGKEKHHG